MINVMGKDRVFLDHGPMQIMLMAWCHGEPMLEEMKEAAGYAAENLESLSRVLRLARDVQTLDYPNQTALPLPLRLMVEGVLKSEDKTLTPMAAVAGTFSDLIADWLADRGATKVLINNGGDIAVRLKGEEKTRIGVTPSIVSWDCSHYLDLESRLGIGGIATSGLGGRSFTKGIADSVTVLADNCRTADACATLIANHCDAHDPGIIRAPAESLDPRTDIAGHLVTVSLDSLCPGTRESALAKGLAKAGDLWEKGIIRGAIIFVGEHLGMIPENICQRLSKEG